MKFKYYLKGIGIGIIFATIILVISGFIHKDNLSDEEIIKRAKELGMVMADSEESDDGLFGKKEDSETESEPESQAPSESQMESESQPESEVPSESESQPESPSESESEVQKEPVTEESTQYVFHVLPGDTPKIIARKLEELGLVDSASDFRAYLSDNGYAKKIRTGSYTITVGMSYEEIADIITRS